MRSPLGLLCALWVLSAANGDQMQLERKRRISGGTLIDISKVKFMVRLVVSGYSDAQSCSGSLIRADWVLTAAHCVWAIEVVKIRVLGNVATPDDLQRSPVIRRVWRKYMAQQQADATTDVLIDVALLQLVQPMNGNKVGTIRYEDSRITEDTDYLIAIGYGATSTYGRDIGTLRYQRVIPVPMDICRSKLFPFAVDEGLLYAQWNNTNPCCTGDSGGPILYKRTVVAVISRGYALDVDFEIGVHTRVQPLAGWIKNTIDSAEQPPRRSFWKFW